VRQQHGGRIGKETPGGWGLNTLHGTAPRPLPCPLHGASSRSNPIPPPWCVDPRFDGEWPRGEPDQIVSPMGTNKSLSAVATPPLLRERVQLYG